MPRYCVGYHRVLHNVAAPEMKPSHTTGVVIIELESEIQNNEDLKLLPDRVLEELGVSGYVDITSVGRL